MMAGTLGCEVKVYPFSFQVEPYNPANCLAFIDKSWVKDLPVGGYLIG